MKTKLLALSIVVLMAFTVATPTSHAFGAKQGAASLFLPTTGQAMNGELGSTKTKVMAGVEVALITTVAILGGVVGGGVIWAGLGPLIANHAWSSYDAYKSANQNQNFSYQQQSQMQQAQQTLEFSRQKRFEREQAMRSSIRDRVSQAGEQAYRGTR